MRHKIFIHRPNKYNKKIIKKYKNRQIMFIITEFSSHSINSPCL